MVVKLFLKHPVCVNTLHKGDSIFTNNNNNNNNNNKRKYAPMQGVALS
jgi:hypothetical protein